MARGFLSSIVRNLTASHVGSKHEAKPLWAECINTKWTAVKIDQLSINSKRNGQYR